MTPMTFSELTANCTEAERVALVFYLGAIRYRSTIQALLPQGEIVNPHVSPHVPEPKRFPYEPRKP
jgi:hypothetical protein